MKESPTILATKRRLISERIAGLASASSSALSRSFGLPVNEVKRILRNKGVNDDG